MSTESGFDSQKGWGNSRFKTIQNVGSGKFAEDVAVKGVSALAVAAAIVSSVVDPSDDKLVIIQLTGHTARVGDVLAIRSGLLVSWEFPVIEVTDANYIKVRNIGRNAADTLGIIPLAADTAQIMRWVSPQYGVDGSLSVSVPTAPAQFVLDGGNQQVVESTTVPANNKPLPVKEISPFFRTKALLDFALSNVTDSAYTQLISSVGSVTISKVQIFMDSGAALYLAFGAAASEVNQAFIIPGGNGILDVTIPPGTRLSVKSVTSGVTVSSGVLLVNLLG